MSLFITLKLVISQKCDVNEKSIDIFFNKNMNSYALDGGLMIPVMIHLLIIKMHRKLFPIDSSTFIIFDPKEEDTKTIKITNKILIE